jgi:antitoxin component of RelBE/YafQ-DinJ toxin-antitoxin module
MKDVMLNVRLDPTLKQHGMKVLEREGVGVTETIRRLFMYLDEHQALPPDLFGSESSANNDIFTQRRALMRSMVGILPTSANIAEAREERLAKHEL